MYPKWNYRTVGSVNEPKEAETNLKKKNKTGKTTVFEFKT